MKELEVAGHPTIKDHLLETARCAMFSVFVILITVPPYNR